MRCDIIIPVWNEKILTARCIDTILHNTRAPYRILIIDNGSETETAGYLDRLALENPDLIKLKRNNENLGFPKAVNQGIALSGAPYICVLNNDTEVYRDWLTEMIKVAESSRGIGIVNPASNNLGRRYTASIREDSGRYMEMSVCVGFCMLIKREVIDNIGTLDEIYSPGNFEDTDFSKRAVRHGYRCVMAKAAYVHHKENTSFKKRKDWDVKFKRNQSIFHERWGRPKRIVYIISGRKRDIFDSVKGGLDAFLKNGDRVWFFLKRGSDKIKMREHASLNIFELHKPTFAIKVLWRILKRKKRFDEVITDSKKFTEVFKLFGYPVQNI